MHLMSQSFECMDRMNPTGQCSIQLVGVVGDMLIDCLDSQNSNLAFSLHWSGRPHLCSGISRYSCSIFKERWQTFTCVVSPSICLGTEQKNGGFRQLCCEPGNELIGNRINTMRQGICNPILTHLAELDSRGPSGCKFGNMWKYRHRGDHDQIRFA